MPLEWSTIDQKPHRYGRDDDDQAAVGLIHEEFAPPAQPPRRASSSFIIALLAISNAMTGVLLLYSLRSGLISGSHVSYVPTHFAPHGMPIPLEPVTIKFEDSLRYNDSSHEFWRDFTSPSAESFPRYFGPPSLLVDAAWSQLLLGEFPGLSDEEVDANPALRQAFTENDRHPDTGHYHIGLDVLHSLHCLNAVRKELDATSLSSSPTTFTHHTGIWAERSQQRIHIDHCLNHIRQSLQCRPDLTPAAMKRHVAADGKNFYIGNAEHHSCYDWSKIRGWLDERRGSELGAWENK